MNEQFEDEYAANHPEIVGKLSSVTTETQEESSALDQQNAPKASKPKYQSDLMARSALTFHKTTQVKTGQQKALTKSLYAAATSERHLLHPSPVQWTEEMIRKMPSGIDEFVSYDTMVSLIAGDLGSYKLLDARSAEENAGDVTGYEYVTASGRIPTSESLPNADYQLSVDDSLSEVLGRLAENLNGKNILKDDHIIWYCGTGWRAARMCVLTQLLGYKNLAIYEGGWNEWYQRNPG